MLIVADSSAIGPMSSVAHRIASSTSSMRDETHELACCSAVGVRSKASPPVRQPHFVTFAAFPLVKAVYLLKS